MTLRITNLELSLMTAISTSKFTTGDGDWVWLSKVTSNLGSERNASTAIDKAIASGLIEIETYPDVKDKGVRLSKFAGRVMTAIKRQ